MPFRIDRDSDPPKEIVVGGSKPKAQPPSVENKQRRKKMADEKISDETSVKKISQEPADKQGPVGTGAEQPANPPSGESGQEDKGNG